MALKDEESLVIGVDVGGTNTDSVLLDLSRPGNSAVVAFHKSPTTPEVTDGVEDSLATLLAKPLSAELNIDPSSTSSPAYPDPSSVTALAIGTTHLLNAIIQRDASWLSPVAVIRLGSHGFLDGALPFTDWPTSLRSLLEGHSATVPGGVNIDGRIVAPLCATSLCEQARSIYALGLQHVVIVGMGSPTDQTFHQEEEAKEMMLAEMRQLDASYTTGVSFVLSHTVAGSGLLARENASILNAAILRFARRTIQSFMRAMSRVGLKCPLYLTSNAGHLLPFSEAFDFPIRIFSSGATNSMRGAAFLVREELNGDPGANGYIVLDVGGTTSDVGALLPNGYPRLSKTYTNLAGVKINLDMPSVESIGLGGGSIIQILDDSPQSTKVAIGPRSVGYTLTTEALCFGGPTPTATDIATACNAFLTDSPITSIGDPHLVNLSPHVLEVSNDRLRHMFESLIDRIKLSPEDSTVILVGGGALLCPSGLRGVRRVIRSQYAGVANAIGAALAKIYGSAEALVDADDVQGGTARVTQAAIANAVAKGGDESKQVITLNETIKWVPYVDGKKMIHVEVSCVADHARVYSDMLQTINSGEKAPSSELGQDEATAPTPTPPVDILRIEPPVDLSTYRPQVLPTGEWVVSATDLKFLEIGCYILGCGGGGSPYATYLALLEQLRQGERIVITSPDPLPDDAVMSPVAAIGTPAVGLERLSSQAVFHALEKLGGHCGFRSTHLLACEIGGMNGLAVLRWATKRYSNVPVVDGDLMGRAFPNFEMVSQYASDEAESINDLLPVAICSGDGRSGIIPSGQEDQAAAGKEIRRVCAQYGFAAGAAGNPLSGAKFRRVGIPNTLSLAWRLGRVVRRAQVESTIGSVSKAIVAEAGGQTSAKKLFTGKVRGVETRITDTGHSLGEVIIESLGEDEVEQGDVGLSNEWSELRVPFVNENLAVIAKARDGEEKTIATVPDLICLLDVATGEAIGVQEYRYGVKVVVMIMAPHPVWTTERGLRIAGPKAFHLSDDYSSSLMYNKPRSVIEEFLPEGSHTVLRGM